MILYEDFKGLFKISDSLETVYYMSDVLYNERFKCPWTLRTVVT